MLEQLLSYVAQSFCDPLSCFLYDLRYPRPKQTPNHTRSCLLEVAQLRQESYQCFIHGKSSCILVF